MTFWEKLHKQAASVGLTFKEYKYRCEQIVIMKLNDIPTCSANTKTDYLVERAKDYENNEAFHFQISDNVISVFPEQYTNALNLVNGLENIKFQAAIGIDANTGKAGRILNYNDILDLWNDYKSNLKDKYHFLRTAEGKEALNNFVSLADKSINDSKSLLEELNSKMFFILFFDKYLVANDGWADVKHVRFISQLFQDINFDLYIQQEIKKESPDVVLIERNASVPKSIKRLKEIEKRYNEKFKPIVQYNFSEYGMNYHALLWINTIEHCLDKAEVSVWEGVANNATLTIVFKLRRLKE